ncbi:MAG: anhydro-N-acetylmuramic acid kinase [candidate division Zixibacteria bacterium]|nr:anhydro-N-acetylmuramic acid kinase [candidate division Zixibacteria bacterium]
MTLAQLVNKKRLVVLGLNSGTSADGLDLAALRITSRGPRPATSFIAGSHRRFPPALRDAILAASDSASPDLSDIIHLDTALGHAFGRTAARFIRHLAARGIRVDLVASHGQTVRHLPEKTTLAGFTVRGTLQLGSLECIAAATGLITTGDFRQADIAIGNEGAPITVAAMEQLFGDERQSRLIVNIGGMANYFYFPAGKNRNGVRAADCGPGNSLSDLLTQRLCREPYDKNGTRARRGRVSSRLLNQLLGDSFFGSRMVSTGRERFGAAMVERVVRFGRRFRLTDDDMIATVSEFTARAIADRLEPLLKGDTRLTKLYLTGGGVHNTFMKRRIRQLLSGLPVSSIAQLGIKPDVVEATAYAVMGAGCIWGTATTTRYDGRSSQRVKPVLGKIVQPPGRV